MICKLILQYQASLIIYNQIIDIIPIQKIQKMSDISLKARPSNKQLVEKIIYVYGLENEQKLFDLMYQNLYPYAKMRGQLSNNNQFRNFLRFNPKIQNPYQFFAEILKYYKSLKLQKIDMSEQRLRISNPFKEKLLTTISHINFSKLQELNLSKSQIAVLQPIVWLNSPMINELNLSQNNVHNVKSLAKTNLKNLTSLKLHNKNQFSYLSFLSRMKFSDQYFVKEIQFLGKQQLYEYREVNYLLKYQIDNSSSMQSEGSESGNESNPVQQQLNPMEEQSHSLRFQTQYTYINVQIESWIMNPRLDQVFAERLYNVYERDEDTELEYGV